jgi:hypothetical protein
MAKTMSNSAFTNALAPQQGKKQAKKEAKLQQQLEEAREAVQRNERKLKKAQQRLEESKVQLSSLEARMSATHFPQHQLADTMPKTHVDGAQEQQSEQAAQPGQTSSSVEPLASIAGSQPYYMVEEDEANTGTETLNRDEQRDSAPPEAMAGEAAPERSSNEGNAPSNPEEAWRPEEIPAEEQQTQDPFHIEGEEQQTRDPFRTGAEEQRTQDPFRTESEGEGTITREAAPPDAPAN